jgi:hypothetical protein
MRVLRKVLEHDMTWTDTDLWKRTLGDDTVSVAEREARDRLRTVYGDFRVPGTPYLVPGTPYLTPVNN